MKNGRVCRNRAQRGPQSEGDSCSSNTRFRTFGLSERRGTADTEHDALPSFWGPSAAKRGEQAGAGDPEAPSRSVALKRPHGKGTRVACLQNYETREP